MTISYKWLSEYLPEAVEPERLNRILTSIGLEVENMYTYEEVKKGLKGLIIGEVLTVEKHPNADKLSLTTVTTGSAEPLQIVCGAPNVAVGQKVVVAPVGATIYPAQGEPLTMKLVKIRGVESQGMICAEDEIGLGASHAGILVLPAELKVGSPAADYFKPYDDIIYEIGLTPNRMDAMSHWGVARDVCAYLSHHDKKDFKARISTSNGFTADNESLPFTVSIENQQACPRYSGVSIANITIQESPAWLQQRLKAIGLRPINNIVDITNYIQHETGQPLHAFDADKIKGRKIVIKNLPEGTPFITLDEKERKLSSEDLMICDEKEGMCIAGVFGGLHSGVTDTTKNIFLESACFNSVTIRKTSFRHGLRTDAATRFEKGTDIAATVNVLKRAALLIKEIANGEIASPIIDSYPSPQAKTQVSLKYHYLKKLSGKNYHPDAVRKILTSLDFEILKEGIDELRVAVPYHKPDISLPADLVEEILRIDGLDNISIPDSIHITPAIEETQLLEAYKEKVAGYLVGLGFNEIMTNSITNSTYFSEQELQQTIKMINSLSAELNVLRPSMLETGLEAIAYNINRKNSHLRFFEFGKIYGLGETVSYKETPQLCLYITGKEEVEGWKKKNLTEDFFTVKGIVERMLQLLGIPASAISALQKDKMETGLQWEYNNQVIVEAGIVNKKTLGAFDIKQPVFFVTFLWDRLCAVKDVLTKTAFTGIPKYPPVERDLAMVVSRSLSYGEVTEAVNKIKLTRLKKMTLFDIFESEKLGIDKKSFAVNFVFQDEEKTLTDAEIDTWMNKIIRIVEKEFQAEIRK